MSKLKSYPIITICLLLLLSALIRWPAFLNPVRGSHAWLSAHTVLTTQIWITEGINNYNFNPVYSFPNAPDQNLRSLASGLNDDKGNYYYVSYPPLSFYIAYLFFLILQIKPSLIGLYSLNILIHAGTSILIYILVCHVYRKNYRTDLFIPALMASALYIFSVQNLWCHVYMYFADSLIQLLWVSHILLAFLIFKRGHLKNRRTLLLFSITNFLIVYTEWLGLFASFVLFIYSLFKSIKKSSFLTIPLLITCTTLIALGITLLQYSNIDGVQSFLDTSVNKYTARNGYDSNGFYLVKLKIIRLTHHYWRFSKANFILLIGLFGLFLISQKKKHNKNTGIPFLLIITFIPILIHHFVFLEFSNMHDFVTLKTSVLYCLLSAILFNSIDFDADQKITLINKRKISLFFFTFIVFLNITLYYSGESLKPSPRLNKNAQFINITSDSQESLFAISHNDRENGIMVYMGAERAFSPQIQILTSRNILAVSKREDITDHLKVHNQARGKVYIFDSYGKMTGIESFSAK